MNDKDFRLSKITTVIWDFDGTLIDSFGLSLEIWTEVLERHGRPGLDPALLAHNYHGRPNDTARGLMGQEASQEEVDQILHEFFEKDDAYITEPNDHLFADAVRLVARAHAAGCRQILITNRPHGFNRGFASPRTFVEGSELSRYIDRVICGDDVEHRKPNPKVLEGIQFNPIHTLVIGDQYIDVEFGHVIGAHTVLINRSDRPIAHSEKLRDKEGEYRIVRTLDEVSD